MKYILVTGGVISGVGKGIIASSLGLLLKLHGWRVTAIKIDPYLNIDAGCFSPYEHGEVFVLDDGGEVDLDLGNYERFMSLRLRRENNITTGKIYQKVISAERAGAYLGKTVQVVPHVTDAIQEWTREVAEQSVDGSGEEPDVCIVELGGTIGDIEGMPFVEAFRQFHTVRVEREDFCTVHVSLIPETSGGEQKTKPTQMGVASLRGMGLFPDLICCRSTRPISAEVRSKVSIFCHVREDQVIGVHDSHSLYHVPLLLAQQGVMRRIEERLKLGSVPRRAPVLSGGDPMREWRAMAEAAANTNLPTTPIAVVGKYVKTGASSEAYTSVAKALQHAAIAAGRRLELRWVQAEDLEETRKEKDPAAYFDAWKALSTAGGVLVPGGFGDRGWEGKLAACSYARTKKLPFLGVCLGMQCAAIEVARNCLGVEGAASDELAAEEGRRLAGAERVVVSMLEHSAGHRGQGMGGTMRLGTRTTAFVTKDSKLRLLYGDRALVEERHRHRYEVNPAVIASLEGAGLRFVGMGLEAGRETGTDEEGNLEALAAQGKEEELAARLKDYIERLRVDALPGEESPKTESCSDLFSNASSEMPSLRMEACELEGHPYFVGVQYHPEYLTQPLKPSPPYLGLLLAASAQPLRSAIPKEGKA